MKSFLNQANRRYVRSPMDALGLFALRPSSAAVRELKENMAFKKKLFRAGGAADISRWRNHRDVGPRNIPALKGRQTRCFGPAPFQGANSNCIRYRWFLHRLISAVPPGQRPETLSLRTTESPEDHIEILVDEIGTGGFLD